ncbi:MAG TPA: ankyrin repeat domain-containing protein [Terriglobales bacterium]
MDDILTAIYRKDYEALERSLQSRIDANTRDDQGRTPLMHAVLAEDADPRLVKLLIQHEADVNSPDEHQWTALHFAARDQKEDIVRTLLDSGASVDALDAFGDTPLWRAVMNFSGNVGIIKMLLKHGADPQKRNNSGVSPIDLAQKSGQAEVLALLERK